MKTLTFYVILLEMEMVYYRQCCRYVEIGVFVFVRDYEQITLYMYIFISIGINRE